MHSWGREVVSCPLAKQIEQPHGRPPRNIRKEQLWFVILKKSSSENCNWCFFVPELSGAEFVMQMREERSCYILLRR